MAGFEFTGTDPTITGYQAVAEFDAPEKLATSWQRTPRGLIVVAGMQGRVFTAEFNGPPPDRDAPITRGEVEASIQRVSGTDVKLNSMTMATRWTDNARQATTYRTRTRPSAILSLSASSKIHARKSRSWVLTHSRARSAQS
jgi:hypothetical protein